MRWISSAAPRLLLALCAVLAGSLCQKVLGSPLVSPTQLIIPATVKGVAAGYWRTGLAVVSGTARGLDAELEFENISGAKIAISRFYAEFLDNQDRRCLTLIFAQDESRRGPEGSMTPGQKRTLTSYTNGLGPAVNPVRVEIYLVEQELDGGHRILGEGRESLYAPPRLQSTSVESWTSLRLTPDTVSGSDQSADLVLARIALDAGGNPTGVTVLRERAPQFATWFPAFLSHLRFDAAFCKDTPCAAETLLLVRAVRFSVETERTPFFPADDAWVQEYMRSFAGSQVPVVHGLLFARCVSEAVEAGFCQAASKSLWAWEAYGTGWSSNIVSFARDSSGKTKLTWRTPESKPTLRELP